MSFLAVSRTHINSIIIFLFLNIFLSSLPVQALTLTYRDNFNTQAYNNSDGTSDWSGTSWIETGDNGNPATGDVLITGGSLKVQAADNAITRQANLSIATSATLSFDFTNNITGGGESLYVEIDNGTSSWVILATHNKNTAASGSFSQDITSYIAANTQIRFRSNNKAGVQVLFDNVLISYVVPDSVLHFAISHDGNGDNCTTENVTITRHDASHATNSSYTGTITLSTSTNHGDWSVVTGTPANLNNGTAGDGAATYTFAGGDNGSVLFGLRNTFAETLNINVTDGTNTEDGTEDSDLVFVGTTTSNVRDQFDAIAYTGNNGSSNWSASWQEVGESDGAGTGNIRVLSDLGSNRLQLQNSSRGVTRLAALNGASSATLTFTYRRDIPTAGTNRGATVDISSTGASGPWTTLATYGKGTDASFQPASIDISPYISATTAIRFLSDAALFSTDQVLFDNIDIQTAYPLSCGGIDHFDIDHDGNGINCLNEAITVIAEYNDNTTVTDYTGSITLNTNTGKGTWTLKTGTPANFNDATANDGIATYTFAAANLGTASFWLYYPEGTSPINISVSDGTANDDNLEGTLTFSPSGFTVTAATYTPPGAITTFNTAQTAGTPFTLYLAAFGQTPTDTTCGIIEAYTGAKNVKFWSTYDDPNTGTRTVSVTGDSTISIATTEGGSAAQPLTFASGKASVSVKYKDVGKMRISLKDDTVTEPAGGSIGATDLFVFKPAGFVLSNIKRTSDAFANPGATDETGTVFIKAGDSFTATVTVRDSEGTATPNYGQESTPETVKLTPAIVAAGGANNPIIGFTSGFDFSAANGTGTGTDFSWGEVGIITLLPSIGDGNYLGAGDVTGTTSGNVGRFTPYDFNVTGNTPIFSPACSGAASFTYVGQPISYSTAPSATITARNRAGATTTNYDNAWWKLTDFTETYAQDTGTPLSGTISLDSSSATHTTVSCTNCNGEINVPFSGTLTYQKGTGSPQVPFNSVIDISFSITDPDSVAYGSNPFTFNNIAFVGNDNEIRWGRLVLTSAHGPETESLDLPATIQEFTTSGFSTNSADACTDLTNAGGTPPQYGDIVLSSFTDNLAQGETTPQDPTFSAGAAGITLTAPGDGNDGSVDIMIDLSTATGADLEWFQYDWNDDTCPCSYTDNPSATATFGIFRGNDRMINWQEKLR